MPGILSLATAETSVSFVIYSFRGFVVFKCISVYHFYCLFYVLECQTVRSSLTCMKKEIHLEIFQVFRKFCNLSYTTEHDTNILKQECMEFHCFAFGLFASLDALMPTFHIPCCSLETSTNARSS